jgi:predicted ester cyclase
MDEHAGARRIVEAFLEAFNTGDIERAIDCFADDALNHGHRAGPAGLKAVLLDIQTRFPDAKLTPLTWVVAGEWIVLRSTYSGTHRGVGALPVDGGMLIGVSPTGRYFEVQHIHMFRVARSKIAEHWANRDDVGMLRQLGLLPPPAAPGR